MGWMLLLIAIGSFVLAALCVKKYPKTALLIAALVSFAAFYYIGKNGYTEVFIFASILYFVFCNAFFIRKRI